MIDIIKKAIEEAKKYHITHYIIACNVYDYPEIKAICKSNFPQIRVRPSGAIERGKVYLWDEPEDVILKQHLSKEQIRKILSDNNETNIEGGNSDEKESTV